MRRYWCNDVIQSTVKITEEDIQQNVYDGLEILTADQFQGRDKKCIIIPWLEEILN